ncbi:MAG: glucose 1-dehydrogenase [Actinobacteria bacterium]|nr:glucose 1-dehydrogenase [Actinomycetota bacterium]
MNQPVVMITGALTGIGRATAITFAKTGATVVVSGRHEDAGQTLAGELKELGAVAEFIYADVRSDDQLAALVEHTTARYGRLDVAVNNAGTDGAMTPVADITATQYAGSFDTNVRGTLLSMKHELQVMQAQRSGSIVNVSSIYGRKGFPGAALYVASKHAIIGLTKSAALEAAAYGVRVNAVGPGPVQTAMFDRVTGNNAQAKAAYLATVPQQRAADPEEIAAAIAYISSPQASYLTGQTIYLDGGITAA